jgi:uncharacterized protein (TIGR02996 family)
VGKANKQSAPGTTHGHPLTYWVERIDDPDRDVAKQARSVLFTVVTLPATEKTAFAPQVPALLDALARVRGSNVSFYVGHCLVGLGPVVLPHLPAVLGTFRSYHDFSPALAKCLIEIAEHGNASALATVIEYLRDVRSGAMPIKGVAERIRVTGPDAEALAPHLIRYFGKGHEWEDRGIVAALGRMRTGTPTLIKALKHRDSLARQYAARSLGQIKDPTAIGPLSDLLAELDYAVATAAARALGDYGELAQAAVPALRQRLTSRSKVVRAAATAALSKIPTDEKTPAAQHAPKVAPRMKKQSEQAEAFFQAILADPENDAPRLIYSDWLEERGNPRGEFIRVQCALAAMKADDPRRSELQTREKELFQQHSQGWREEVPAWAARHGTFRRGFLAEVRCTAKAFLKGAAGLFRRAPVHELVLGFGMGEMPSVADSPWLARLTRLRMSLDDPAAGILGRSPHLGNLRILDLSMGRIADDGAKALATSPHLTRLTELYLHGNEIGGGGVEALAASPHLCNLHLLHLGGNRNLRDRGAEALASATHLRELSELGLWYCNITGPGAAALARSTRLPGLTSLKLANNAVGDEGAIALAESPHLARLETLDLRLNQIGDAGAQGLANARSLTNLTELELGNNPITDAGVLALAASTRLVSLRSLRLLHTRASDAGALALANSALPIVSVQLPHSLGEEAREALKRRFSACRP